MSDLITQLRGISCDRAVGFGPNKVLSVPDAIGQVLALHETEKEGVQQDLLSGVRAAPSRHPGQCACAAAARCRCSGYDPGETFIGTCPECHSGLQYMEGCVKCLSCGYSECG